LYAIEAGAHHIICF